MQAPPMASVSSRMLRLRERKWTLIHHAPVWEPSTRVSALKPVPLTPLRPAGADAQHQPEQCGEGRWEGGARGREGGAAAQQQRRARTAAAGAWECMMATL